MVKTVSAQKARQRLGRLLDDVHRNGDQYVIERAGQPIAAVVPVWLLEERLARKKKFFDHIEEIWQRNRDVPPEATESEVAEAIREVRAKSSRRSS